MGLPVPLELATTVGAGRIVDTPPVRVVILPAEVYSSGALVRVRVEHRAPPKTVVDQPALAGG